VLGLALTACACGAAAPPIVQPGSPGSSSRTIDARTASDQSRIRFTPADVTFMQGMIHHHAQALDMAALVPSRTASDDMKKLAKRIEVSQTDEIAMMRHWLESRGQAAPGPHAHHEPGAVLMPGMLTAAEMDRLSAARGADFDRLFLEGMIKHHGGALNMVRDLLATPGAGQEPEMFAFASDVDADQRMEIDRMSVMLKELGK
jgi:uncharacterized protein (DUF305 family)